MGTLLIMNHTLFKLSSHNDNPLLISKPPLHHPMIIPSSSLSLVPCLSLAERRKEAKVRAEGGHGDVVVKDDDDDDDDDDVPVEKVEDEKEKMKKTLVEWIDKTALGIKTSAKTRAEIEELVNKLEANNPSPPLFDSQTLSLLNGKWILMYASITGLIPMLPRTNLALIEVEEISETINSENFTVKSSFQLATPFSTTNITTNSKFEVISPKIVLVKFEEGIIGTPQPNDSRNTPDNIEIVGQNIDLSPIKGLISSVQGIASSVVKTISDQPPLKFDINERIKLWILDTYIDEDLRILRGDSGVVFVLLKEGSPLLSQKSNSGK